MFDGNATRVILVGFLIFVLIVALFVGAMRLGIYLNSINVSRENAVVEEPITTTGNAIIPVSDTGQISILSVILNGTPAATQSFLSTYIASATSTLPSDSVYKTIINIDISRKV